MKSVYTGGEKVAEFESYDELRVGDSKPAFVYEGNELVYPNPVKDGMELWYDFSGRTNTDSQRGIAEDLSGNGNHGTLQNFNYSAESGYGKNKLIFDGVDDSLTIPEIALDETAMTVIQDGKLYAYEDDKVIEVKKYSEDGSSELVGIEVGGRNLILDSSNIQSRSRAVGITSEKVTDMGYTNVLKINNPELKSYFTIFRDSYAGYPTATKDFTLSFLVRGIADENSTKTLTAYYNGSTLYVPMKGEIKEDEYSWVSVTFNTDDIIPNNHIGVSSFKELYFAKIMVSMGSEATEWSPAPEDFQTTSLSPSSLSNLQLYNRPLRKDELLQNAESEGLKELKDGVPVQDGLVLHYDFSHESNISEYREKAFDYSGNGNHGKLYNFNFTEESGYREEGLKFDGIDDEIIVDTITNASTKDIKTWTFDVTIDLKNIESRGSIFNIPCNPDRLSMKASGGNISIGRLTNGYWSGRKTPLLNKGLNNVTLLVKYLNNTESPDTSFELDLYVSGVKTDHSYANSSEYYANITNSLILGYQNTVASNGEFAYLDESILSAKIYNRLLSPEEIAHNYAIEKERFSIE